MTGGPRPGGQAIGSVARVSPFRAHAHAAISQSAFFRQMLASSPEPAARPAPASWYLRHGIMGSGYPGPFAPVVFRGPHDDIFRAGLDPLVHFALGDGGHGPGSGPGSARAPRLEEEPA